MHRGGVSSGHYWIFIYDHSQKIWRNYNDGYVTEVTSLAEIFDQGDATRPTTAAFVVYIKADHEQELSESVCREVREREVPADRQYHSGFQPNFIDGTPMEVDEIEAYEQTPDPNDPNAVDW